MNSASPASQHRQPALTVAVLGATGAAGRAFCPLASASGFTLRTERTDIFDLEALTTALQGCDAVVNLATSIPSAGGRGNWDTNDRIRREGTANLIAACAAARVPLLVQQSVAMLHCVSDTRPQNEEDAMEGYGRIASAFDMEALLDAAPLDARLVRGGGFYGPGTGRKEAWQAEVRNPAFRIPGDGTAWLSPVHVEDYGAALLAVLQNGLPHTAYIACEDQPLQLSQLYGALARQAGMPTPESGGPQFIRSFRTSNTRLRGLGWAPQHALHEGLALRPDQRPIPVRP